MTKKTLCLLYVDSQGAADKGCFAKIRKVIVLHFLCFSPPM